MPTGPGGISTTAKAIATQGRSCRRRNMTDTSNDVQLRGIALRPEKQSPEQPTEVAQYISDKECWKLPFYIREEERRPRDRFLLATGIAVAITLGQLRSLEEHSSFQAI